MSATVRNAMLDAIEAAIGTSAKLIFFSGAVPVNCAAPTTGTKLLEFDLASDWAADASAGAKALSGLPLTVAAVAGGTLGYFRIFASDGSTCAAISPSCQRRQRAEHHHHRRTIIAPGHRATCERREMGHCGTSESCLA
jgi:hypothetical protein